MNKRYIQIIASGIVFIIGFCLLAFVAWWTSGASTSSSVDDAVGRGLGTASFFALAGLASFMVSFIIMLFVKTNK